jgi:putative transposase
MRYRDYKTFAAGEYYHVFNRGNGKGDIYLNPEDYKIFLYRLNENLFPEPKLEALVPGAPLIYQRKLLPKGAFSLICYCLMPNHFHMLIRQNSDVKISKFIQKLCTGYAVYFQKKYEHTGHLFQGAFKAIHIESESYLMWLSAYIHQNPATAGLVTSLEDYPWSSYLDFIGKRNGKLCSKDVILKNFQNQDDYKKFVESSGELIKQKKEIQSLFLE